MHCNPGRKVWVRDLTGHCVMGQNTLISGCLSPFNTITASMTTSSSFACASLFLLLRAPTSLSFWVLEKWTFLRQSLMTILFSFFWGSWINLRPCVVKIRLEYGTQLAVSSTQRHHSLHQQGGPVFCQFRKMYYHLTFLRSQMSRTCGV